MKKTVARLLAALALLAGVGLASPATAQAASSCSGTISGRSVITDVSGATIAELVVFYSPANGGTNTACLNHLGATRGIYTWTSVQIGRCTTYTTGCTSVDRWSSPDIGSFAYYAGPVSVTGTAARCVQVKGFMQWRGYHYSLSGTNIGCPAADRWSRSYYKLSYQ